MRLPSAMSHQIRFFRYFRKISHLCDWLLLIQSGNSINHEGISSRLLCSLKKKSKSVIKSIEGYQMTDFQKHHMLLVLAHKDYITSTLTNIDSMSNSLIEPYENAVQLLCTISEAERMSAITIFSEIWYESNVYAARRAWFPIIMRRPIRRTLFESHVPASTSSLYWYELPMQP